MRIPLDMKPWNNPMVRGPIAVWRDSEPFVQNLRGILIHRPRFVRVHKNGRRPAHIAIEYYCGAVVTGDGGHLTFLDAPPEDSLLCTVCEARAVMAGLPTATAIAGRHVHVGKLKAVMVCCREAESHDAG